MKGNSSKGERCKHSEMYLQEQGSHSAAGQTNSANALLHIALTLEGLLHSLLMAKGNQQRDTLIPALRGRGDLTL